MQVGSAQARAVTASRLAAGPGPRVVVLAEIAATWWLHVLGRAEWAAVPLDRTQLLTALPADLLAGGARLAALGLAWWCLVTTITALVLGRCGSVAAGRRALHLVPGFLRRHVERGVVAAATAGAVLAPTVAVAAPLPPALAPQEVTTTDEPRSPGPLPSPTPEPGPLPSRAPSPDPAPVQTPTATPAPPPTRPATPVVPPPPGATVPDDRRPPATPSPGPATPPTSSGPARPTTEPTSSEPSPAPTGTPASTVEDATVEPSRTEPVGVPTTSPAPAPPRLPAPPTHPGPVPHVLLGIEGSVAPATDTTDEHVVRAGEHLWAIARAHLASVGLPADDDDVAAHWRRVVALNRDRLGGDPDLVVPGQVVLLPDVTRP